MPRMVYLLGVGILLVSVAFLLTDAMVPRPSAGVSEAAVRRVKAGMTLKEVEAILGGPGRPLPIMEGSNRPITAYRWDGANGVAVVIFDLTTDPPEEVARSAIFEQVPEPGPLPRLRAWLGR